MEYICIGKIVNTHGIKGEVRIKSDFKYKSQVFKKDTKLYIGELKEEKTINTYRIHKDYDMVTLTNITDINDVLKFKNKLVYVDKSSIEIEYLDEDLIGMDVYMNKYIGKVDNLKKGIKYDFLVVNKILIPNIKEFVKKIDVKNKKITLNSWEGFFDEN